MARQDRQVSFNINGNISTYKNKVIKLGSSDIFNSTRLDRINITTEGQPIGMFYGFKVEGIYRQESEVTSLPMTTVRRFFRTPLQMQPSWILKIG